MSEYVVSAQESNVTIEGTKVDGLQSLEYRVERGQIDVTAIGQETFVGMAESGLLKVTGNLRVRSLCPVLDALLLEPVPTAFSMVATLVRAGTQIRQIEFEDCYLDDKSFEMETGGVGLTVYNFTAKTVRES
jgi:hypothetical protein